MDRSEQQAAVERLRREPPRFRAVEVRRAEPLTPRLIAVTLGGDDLEGFELDQPAASVRLLLPSPGSRELVTPAWTGNEFRLPDGRRATIRTLTPRRFDPEALELEVWIVVHGGGAASEWAEAAQPGDPAAVSGPGRGYTIDPDAAGSLLAGDETALAAISQLLERLPDDHPVAVHVELARPDGRLALPPHPRAEVTWHDLAEGAAPGDALFTAVRQAPLPDDARVWVAGEAAAVQRIRRHLFEERGLSRRAATVRGYWKHGRAAEGDDS